MFEVFSPTLWPFSDWRSKFSSIEINIPICPVWLLKKKFLLTFPSSPYMSPLLGGIQGNSRHLSWHAHWEPAACVYGGSEETRECAEKPTWVCRCWPEHIQSCFSFLSLLRCFLTTFTLCWTSHTIRWPWRNISRTMTTARCPIMATCPTSTNTYWIRYC